MSSIQSLASHVHSLGAGAESAASDLASLTKHIAQMQQQIASAGRAGVDISSVSASLSATASSVKSASASASRAGVLARKFADSLAHGGGGEGGLGGGGGLAGDSMVARYGGSAIPGGREYLPAEDTYLKQCAATMNAPAGYYNLVMHGDANNVYPNDQMMDADQLAELVRDDPDWGGQSVFLLSCNTGHGDNPIAQQLADRLDTPVLAPQDYGTFDHGNPPNPVSRMYLTPDLNEHLSIQTSFRLFLPRS